MIEMPHERLCQEQLKSCQAAPWMFRCRAVEGQKGCNAPFADIIGGVCVVMVLIGIMSMMIAAAKRIARGD